MPGLIRLITGLESGLTLTASLFPDMSDTAVPSLTDIPLTSAGDGVYVFSNPTVVGLHVVKTYEDGIFQWRNWINLVTTGTAETTETREGSVVVSDSGSGARLVTVTVIDGDAPIQGARIRVTSAGESYVLTTDSNGIVEFSLNDGSWKLTASRVGYQASPVEFELSGELQLNVEMQAVSVPNADPNLVNGYLQCLDESGNPEPGVAITIVIDEPATEPGISYDATPRTISSDENGMVVFSGLSVGARYSVWRGDRSFTNRFRVGITDPFPIPSFKGRT